MDEIKFCEWVKFRKIIKRPPKMKDILRIVCGKVSNSSVTLLGHIPVREMEYRVFNYMYCDVLDELINGGVIEHEEYRIEYDDEHPVGFHPVIHGRFRLSVEKIRDIIRLGEFESL